MYEDELTTNERSLSDLSDRAWHALADLLTAEAELHGHGVGSGCLLDRLRTNCLHLMAIVRDDCEAIDRELRPDPELPFNDARSCP